MKPALQLNIGQQLTLTPQLQQAIRLLQLSSLDLSEEVQELLNSNPMLEQDEESNKGANKETTSEQKESDTDKTLDLASNEDIPQELATDTVWEDILPTAGSRKVSNNDGGDYEKQRAHSVSLHDQLHAQINLTHLSDTDHAIATALIDAIDDQGLLICSLDDIQNCVNNFAGDEHQVNLTEIETVLHHIQSLEPIGIGARDLRECLLIQLLQLPEDTPWLQETHTVIDKHFPLLAKRDYTQLIRSSKYNKTELEHIILLIQSLNPRPASQVEDVHTQYVIPDIIVSKRNDQWHIELNDENLPKLRINQSYSSLIQRNCKDNDHTFMRNQLQEARWFFEKLTESQ